MNYNYFGLLTKCSVIYPFIYFWKSRKLMQIQIIADIASKTSWIVKKNVYTVTGWCYNIRPPPRDMPQCVGFFAHENRWHTLMIIGFFTCTLSCIYETFSLAYT